MGYNHKRWLVHPGHLAGPQKDGFKIKTLCTGVGLGRTREERLVVINNDKAGIYSACQAQTRSTLLGPQLSLCSWLSPSCPCTHHTEGFPALKEAAGTG